MAGVEEKKIKSLMGQNQEMTGAAPGNMVMNKPRVPGVKQGMNRSQSQQQSQASEEEKEEVEEEETFEEASLELIRPVKEEHGSRKVFPNLKKHYSKKLSKNDIVAQSHIFNSKEDSYDGVEKSAFSKITDLSGYLSKLHRARGISVPRNCLGVDGGQKRLVYAVQGIIKWCPRSEGIKKIFWGKWGFEY